MKRPIVSIITPTYRHENVLHACVQSVISQSYPYWEQIIVDDGSDDNTFEIARQYSEVDNRICVLRREHQGIDHLSELYNVALNHSQGELIAILEGDDSWPADKLSVQVKLHSADDDLLMSHGVVEIVRGGTVIGKYSSPPEKGRQHSQDYLKWAMQKRSSIMPVSVVVKKSALLEIGGFHQPKNFPAVDYPTWMKLFQLPGSVEYIDHVLGFWNQSSVQVTQNQGLLLAESALHIAMEQYDSMDKTISKRLIPSKKELFMCHFDSTLSDSYLGGLRTALAQRDRHQALYCIKKLLYWGSAKRKLQAVFGFFLLSVGKNMEWLFNLVELWNRTRKSFD